MDSGKVLPSVVSLHSTVVMMSNLCIFLVSLCTGDVIAVFIHMQGKDVLYQPGFSPAVCIVYIIVQVFLH